MALSAAELATKVKQLTDTLVKSETLRKKVNLALVAEREKTTRLEQEVARLQAELTSTIESSKRAVRKARERASNSKERANRFKAKLDRIAPPSA